MDLVERISSLVTLLSLFIVAPPGPRESAALVVGRTHTTVSAISAHCAFDEHDDRVDGPYRSLRGCLEGKSKASGMVCLDQSGNTYRRQC